MTNYVDDDFSYLSIMGAYCENILNVKAWYKNKQYKKYYNPNASIKC